MWGEWIEIRLALSAQRTPVGLSPCGESGLKWIMPGLVYHIHQSLPMRGEWIEIVHVSVEIIVVTSLTMRGEWIEIRTALTSMSTTCVSPHAGRVD